eukprot:5233469-Ditylum_brightwellii.AAC.1
MGWHPIIMTSMPLHPDVVLRPTPIGRTPGNCLEILGGSDKADEVVGIMAATGPIHFIHEIFISWHLLCNHCFGWRHKANLKWSGGSLCWTTILGAVNKDALAVVVNKECSDLWMSSARMQVTGVSGSKWSLLSYDISSSS